MTEVVRTTNLSGQDDGDDLDEEEAPRRRLRVADVEWSSTQLGPRPRDGFHEVQRDNDAPKKW
jgi:hypothetical protein